MSTSSLLFPTISSTTQPSSLKRFNPTHALVNRIGSSPSTTNGSEEDSSFKTHIICVMESIVYLGDIGETTTPENIERMSHVLHPEIVIDLADIQQALNFGTKKAIFTWSSKISNTWAIDTKNIETYTQNNTYVQFLRSMANDTKSRMERIRAHFNATKRKLNPVVSYSKVFQDNQNQNQGETATLQFSDLGLKPNQYDPSINIAKFVTYHDQACQNPTSIHYAARLIYKSLSAKIKESNDVESSQPQETDSKLDLIERGHKMITIGAVKLQMNTDAKDAPQWKSSSFSIENTIPSGEKPSQLSSFAIVPPKSSFVKS